MTRSLGSFVRSMNRGATCLCSITEILSRNQKLVQKEKNEERNFCERQYLTRLRIVRWSSTSWSNKLLPPVSCRASTILHHTTALHSHSLRQCTRHDDTLSQRPRALCMRLILKTQCVVVEKKDRGQHITSIFNIMLCQWCWLIF